MRFFRVLPPTRCRYAKWIMSLAFSPTYASSEDTVSLWSLVISYPVTQSLFLLSHIKHPPWTWLEIHHLISNYVTPKHEELPHSKSLLFNPELQKHLCVQGSWAESDQMGSSTGRKPPCSCLRAFCRDTVEAEGLKETNRRGLCGLTL